MGKILDRFLGADRTLTREVIDPTTDPPSGVDAAQILPPARSHGDRKVTDKDALGISMVYRAVGIHAITAKQMSIGEWVSSTLNDELNRATATSAFLRKPDPEMPRSAFIEMTVISMACTGNAYWRLTWAGGQILAARVLDPNTINPVMDDTNSYVVGYRLNGVDRLVPPNEIKHLKLMRVPGMAIGYGPIQAAQAELRGAIDLSAYAGNFFSDSSMPTGVLSSANVLNAEQAKMYKAAFKASMAGKRDVAVLGQGLSYTPVFIKPADAQFLESKQYTTTEIARLFGVPSSLMLANVQGSSMTYQNVEQDWLGFIRFSNMQYLIEIEDALTDLLPLQREARFNVEALLRTDTKSRYDAHKIGLDAGFLFVDEIRKIEKLGPVPASEKNKPTRPAPVPVTKEQDETETE